MKKINLFGIMINDCTCAELLQNISVSIYAEKKKKVMYANIHVINTALHDGLLKKALNSADIVYCDGEGVRLGARLLEKSLMERMTGADWIHDLCIITERHGYSIYLLGGEHGTAEMAKERLQDKYKELNIVGAHHGYFDFTGEENDRVIADINKNKPHILLVGFGTPLQEKWIDQNRDKLDAAIVWAAGAVMDFVSEKVPRAPAFMLTMKMEWLYRLYQEPWRMWRRYCIGNIVFFIRILIDRIKFFEQ